MLHYVKGHIFCVTWFEFSNFDLFVFAFLKNLFFIFRVNKNLHKIKNIIVYFSEQTKDTVEGADIELIIINKWFSFIHKRSNTWLPCSIISLWRTIKWFTSDYWYFPKFYHKEDICITLSVKNFGSRFLKDLHINRMFAVFCVHGKSGMLWR